MSLSLNSDTLPFAVADWRATTATLEDLLSHSIRLRDLYKGARLQVLSGHARFPSLRQVLEAHYQEQLLLIDTIVERIAELGGAVSSESTVRPDREVAMFNWSMYLLERTRRLQFPSAVFQFSYH